MIKLIFEKLIYEFFYIVLLYNKHNKTLMNIDELIKQKEELINELNETIILLGKAKSKSNIDFLRWHTPPPLKF